MPFMYSSATADLGTLETRLSAARATALDELLAGNIPTDLAGLVAGLTVILADVTGIAGAAMRGTDDGSTALALADAASQVTSILADVTGIAGAAMRGTDGVDTTAMRGTDAGLLAVNYLGHQFTSYEHEQTGMAIGEFYVPARNTIITSIFQPSANAANKCQLFQGPGVIKANLAGEYGFVGTYWCDGTDMKFKNNSGNSDVCMRLKGLTMV